MPTITDVYNPLVEAAQKDDPAGSDLLRATGKLIFEANPGLCTSIEDGIEAAKRNLDYYCQYFSADIAIKTKRFYGLDPRFTPLGGRK